MFFLFLYSFSSGAIIVPEQKQIEHTFLALCGILRVSNNINNIDWI